MKLYFYVNKWCKIILSSANTFLTLLSTYTSALAAILLWFTPEMWYCGIVDYCFTVWKYSKTTDTFVFICNGTWASYNYLNINVSPTNFHSETKMTLPTFQLLPSCWKSFVRNCSVLSEKKTWLGHLIQLHSADPSSSSPSPSPAKEVELQKKSPLGH